MLWEMGSSNPKQTFPSQYIPKSNPITALLELWWFSLTYHTTKPWLLGTVLLPSMIPICSGAHGTWLPNPCSLLSLAVCGFLNICFQASLEKHELSALLSSPLIANTPEQCCRHLAEHLPGGKVGDWLHLHAPPMPFPSFSTVGSWIRQHLQASYQ